MLTKPLSAFAIATVFTVAVFQKPLLAATPAERELACQTSAISVGADYTEIGNSAKGRPILAKTIGAGSRRIVWIGGIHGNEHEGKVSTENLPSLVTPDIGQKITLLIIQDLNPDGTEANTRNNSNGVDLNRNFPAASFDATVSTNGLEPLSQPESCVLFGQLMSFDPELTIVAHSHSKVRGINFDGPSLAEATLFAQATNFQVVTNDELSTVGHPGSLGQWWGFDKGKKLLTLEFQRGEDPVSGWRDASPGLSRLLIGEPQPISTTSPSTEVAPSSDSQLIVAPNISASTTVTTNQSTTSMAVTVSNDEQAALAPEVETTGAPSGDQSLVPLLAIAALTGGVAACCCYLYLKRKGRRTLSPQHRRT